MPTLTTFDGTWVNNPTDDADLYLDAGELRRADAALFASGGVARGLTVAVSASDVVTVQPGTAVIDGDLVAAGTGVYRAGLAAIATGPLDARDATYSRVDLVVLRQFDPDVVPAHTTRKQAVEVITGTPAAVPTAPALPSLAVELGRITVPASGGAAASVNTASVVAVRLIGGSGIIKGSAGITTDVNGIATITHTLGAIPAGAIVQPVLSTTYVDLAPTSEATWTTTTFKVRAFRSDGTLYQGSLSKINYQIWA